MPSFTWQSELLCTWLMLQKEGEIKEPRKVLDTTHLLRAPPGDSGMTILSWKPTHMHVANSVNHLDGKVPKMQMCGETANISNAFMVNRIMYIPGRVKYPNKQFCQGKNFGPAMETRLTMTAKVLQHNSRCWSLTIEETASMQLQLGMQSSKETSEKCLDSKFTQNTLLIP